MWSLIFFFISRTQNIHRILYYWKKMLKSFFPPSSLCSLLAQFTSERDFFDVFVFLQKTIRSWYEKKFYRIFKMKIWCSGILKGECLWGREQVELNFEFWNHEMMLFVRFSFILTLHVISSILFSFIRLHFISLHSTVIIR